MATLATATELRNMPLEDLRRELKAQVVTVEKMRISIRLQKEKDVGRYRRERKQVAVMKTVLNEKERDLLRKKEKTNTVPATSL